MSRLLGAVLLTILAAFNLSLLVEMGIHYSIIIGLGIAHILIVTYILHHNKQEKEE